MDSYQCAQHIRENCQQGNLWIPIIFLSADITEDAIVKGIDAGGDDYLPKPITQRVLSAKLRAMARIADMRKELEAASADLRRLSSIDGLTQLYNRRHFDETLELEWSRSSRTKEPLSLILCDIDHFKALALLELNLVEYLGSLLAPQILELGCPLYPPRLLRQESCDNGG